MGARRRRRASGGAPAGPSSAISWTEARCRRRCSSSLGPGLGLPGLRPRLCRRDCCHTHSDARSADRRTCSTGQRKPYSTTWFWRSPPPTSRRTDVVIDSPTGFDAADEAWLLERELMTTMSGASTEEARTSTGYGSTTPTFFVAALRRQTQPRAATHRRPRRPSASPGGGGGRQGLRKKSRRWPTHNVVTEQPVLLDSR